MIKQIFIKDYILIDEITVNFDKGLNVITGETGAGKSILINAIDIVFGAKVSKDVIKKGAEKSVIEIVTENKNHDFSALFEQNGIEYTPNEIIISKEITQTSSRSRVNGILVGQEFIKELREALLDVHSQHQAYTFLHPKYHIELLDKYAEQMYGNILTEYKLLFKHYQNLLTELNFAKNSANATENQIEFLKFQIEEIENANIENIDEEELLKNELAVLENVEVLKELSGQTYWALNGDDNSILTALNEIKQKFSKANSLDEVGLNEIAENLFNATEMLADTSSAIRNYNENLTNDTQRLNDIQERLFLFDKLKRKYGNSLENVLNEYEKFKTELNSIELSTQKIEELQQKISDTLANLNSLAEKISEKRKDYAQVLSAFIIEKLNKLELPKSKFEIAVEKSELNENGFDKVEFLISTNISEDLKPLIKVASGGEISRVMLAIKSIFAQNDDIDTVIFDEIDTGISGKTSQSVAEEILELSKSHQIILITHQAIIASKAHKHFYIYKTQEDLTKVMIYELDEENKLMALAQLASGEVNDTSMEFAKSLIS